MRHDSQEWTIATEAKARETGTASATAANNYGATAEMEASVGAATSGATTVQGSTVGCMSATKAGTEASMTGTLVAAAHLAETKAGGSDVTNGSTASGRASTVMRDTTAVTSVIGQMAVDAAAATDTAT